MDEDGSEFLELDNQMAFITDANARSIIYRNDINELDLHGKIYKRNINFFSKFEENELLAIQELLDNPEKYFTETYKPFKKPKDTLAYVFKSSLPAYHRYSSCELLNSNYVNYEIPLDIQMAGKKKVKKFRRWFKEVQHLFDSKPDVFEARLLARWGIVSNIEEMRIENSGISEFENYSINDLESRIEIRLKSADRYLKKSKKTKSILNKLSKFTYLAYKYDKIRLNDTGYSDEEVRKVLKKYDKKFKKPLKNDLISYYKVTLNPRIKIKGRLLKNLGFKPCKHCHDPNFSKSDQKLLKQNRFRIGQKDDRKLAKKKLISHGRTKKTANKLLDAIEVAEIKGTEYLVTRNGNLMTAN